MKIEDKVNTPDGIGTIKAVEHAISFTRYGVLHDTYPSNRILGLYLNNILYYTKAECILLT